MLLNVYWSLWNSQLIWNRKYLHKVNDTVLITLEAQSWLIKRSIDWLKISIECAHTFKGFKGTGMAWWMDGRHGYLTAIKERDWYTKFLTFVGRWSAIDLCCWCRIYPERFIDKLRRTSKYLSKSCKFDPEGSRSPIGLKNSAFFLSWLWLYYSIKKIVNMWSWKSDIFRDIFRDIKRRQFLTLDWGWRVSIA